MSTMGKVKKQKIRDKTENIWKNWLILQQRKYTLNKRLATESQTTTCKSKHTIETVKISSKTRQNTVSGFESPLLLKCSDLSL